MELFEHTMIETSLLRLPRKVLVFRVSHEVATSYVHNLRAVPSGGVYTVAYLLLF